LRLISKINCKSQDDLLFEKDWRNAIVVKNTPNLGTEHGSTRPHFKMRFLFQGRFPAAATSLLPQRQSLLVSRNRWMSASASAAVKSFHIQISLNRYRSHQKQQELVDKIESKRKEAFLGGGLKRIETQHAKVST
jgi:hypothetical protein